MPTVNDVYNKIKEMSVNRYNPRPDIAIKDLEQEFHMSKSDMQPCLMYLKQLKLIDFAPAMSSLKLTMLGLNASATGNL